MLAQRADEVLGQRIALVDVAADLADISLLALGLGLGLDMILIIGISHRLAVGEDSCLGNDGEFTPWLLSEGGLPKDYSFMPIRQYGERYSGTAAEGFSALLDAYYMKRDKAERMRVRSQSLTKQMKTQRDRVARKLALQREELKQTADREEVRRRGDLITANIYRIRRGDSSLECEDYYAEGQPTVIIPLDARKTPQQNAAACYKEYNKAKTAEQHLTVLIQKGEQELEYLDSVLSELSRAETEIGSSVTVRVKTGGSISENSIRVYADEEEISLTKP